MLIGLSWLQYAHFVYEATVGLWEVEASRGSIAMCGETGSVEGKQLFLGPPRP